ncbi:UvrB/UvrC motif-containing protein, partial [Patescibacteria group bacterium]|nr:UvrB/UvrC motif-containing protein [Patescibacteria group bacterium]
NIKNLIKILQGKRTQALKDLKRKMKKFSKTQEFERAAKLRDQIGALENVFEHAQVFQGLVERKIQNWRDIEKKLKKILGIKRKIKRIEGYDISNIQGKEATGAMVVFENGTPDKNEYRKFKIKISDKPNDIAMLKEVISRRLNHPEWKFPQIMLIDGGVAQLNATKQTIKQSSNSTIKVMALAKRKNELYVEGKERPILLKNLPQEVSNLILHIRDEAHRFAIKYHRKLREIDFREKP